MTTKEERDMINSLHKKRGIENKVERETELFQKMLPALRALIKAGGSADALMKKSGPIAAYKLVELLSSEKEDIVLKASEKIISYDIGKPVERSVSIYGDLSKMNETDVDNQILQLLNKAGAPKLLEASLNLKRPKRKMQKRKPRQDALIIEATAQPSERPKPSAETGPASESQD